MAETLWTPQGEIPIERILYKAPNRETGFVDKKIPILNEEGLLEYLAEARRIYREGMVGQREATVKINPAYPELPSFHWLLNDPHTGNIHTDYTRFANDYHIVKDTPNFYCLTNGDLIDNFMVDYFPLGIHEDPITPEQQALLLHGLMKKLDDENKLDCMSFGNHEDAAHWAGRSFEGTWLRDLKCPYFHCGGLLTLQVGRQEYKIAMTHRFWGFSKLNPTNVCKRYMEYVWPDADIVYIGHSHQAESLSFSRGGKNRLAILGGTYKLDDEYGRKKGFGGGQMGGMVLELDPYKKEFRIWRSVEDARKQFALLLELRQTKKL